MTVRFETDLLIPGRGEPSRDGVVVVDDASIAYAGPATTASAASGATTVRAPAVMPGLWECHGHFMGIRSFDLSRLPLEPIAVRAARASADLRAALDAGVISVREPGGLGVYLARPLAEGLLTGPRRHGELKSCPYVDTLDCIVMRQVEARHGTAGGGRGRERVRRW